MKTNFNFLIATVLSVVLMVSCNKEQNFSTINGKAQIGKSIAYNPANPYDSVGIWHNEAIDYFISLGWDSLDMTTKSKASLDSAYDIYFGTINFEYTTTEINTTQHLKEFWFGDLYGVSANELIDYAYTNSIISNTVKLYSDTILEMINSATEYSTSDETFNTLITTFTEYENDIILRSMDSIDRAIVLEMTSVAKHSAEFWNNEINLPNDIFGLEWASLAAFDWKWKECLGADVSGAVAGAVTGTIAGGIAGTLPGAGLGAVGASVGYTMGKVWAWLT